MRPRRWARRAAVTGGVATAVGLGFYAAQRLALQRLRSRPDPDADRVFEPRFDRRRVLPSHDGGTLAVIERGSGPPVVLSHGVALSVRTWCEQLEELPDLGVRAIAFDHRGHGASTSGASGYSVDNLAEDVRSVLEGLDLHDVVLVGHSMGGVAVQAFAIRFPEVAAARVRGLVLLSTLARTQIAHSPALIALLRGVYDRTPDLGQIMARPQFGTLLARLGFGRDARPSHVELTRQMLAACAPETNRHATSALLDLDLTSELHRIAVPTLVVCGGADVLTPPRESRRIADAIPEARLHLFPGGGHMLMLERSHELNRLLADFAREVGAARAAGAVG